MTFELNFVILLRDKEPFSDIQKKVFLLSNNYKVILC